uniref:Chitin-binding type-4 domain-containing protein n=1 Tax=Clytia hemisphaerica TaxID=252671 RepID=A0A7M5VCW4_9CNID
MKTLLVLSLVVALCVIPEPTAGHGAMLLPYSWFDYKMWVKTKDGYKFDFVGIKSEQQCTAGSQIPRDVICPAPGSCGGYPYPSPACMWFNNYTHIEKPTLFDQKLRTYPHNEYPQYVLHNPWRAPGAAPISSPCGVAGGNPNGCIGGPKCGQDQGGFDKGPKAEDVDFPFHIHVTNWTRGEAVEVAWAIRANHGGGYSFRLCKMPEQGRKALTEECFQQTPLRFVGDRQWVQYGEDQSTRYEFPAVRTDKGTFPPGSQWTKNPIPACNGLGGGYNDPNPNKCSNGTQFPPPGPGLLGFGVDITDPLKNFPFSIIDLVQIPKDLEEGEYVLSFRWDCEQSPQVWNTCSSVRLH